VARLELIEPMHEHDVCALFVLDGILQVEHFILQQVLLNEQILTALAQIFIALLQRAVYLEQTRELTLELTVQVGLAVEVLHEIGILLFQVYQRLVELFLLICRLGQQLLFFLVFAAQLGQKMLGLFTPLTFLVQ
jgi:hypothetical protein